MRGLGRISLAFTTVLLLCTLWSAPVSADGGRKKHEARRASAAGAPSKAGGASRSKTATAKKRKSTARFAGEKVRAPRGARDRARVRVKFTWTRLTRRYQQLVTEGRKRERSIDRSCQRIERDLVHLGRARRCILNASIQGDRPERPDPVLVQVAGVRKRLGQAAIGYRSVLRKTLISVRRNFQRLDREYRPVHRPSVPAPAGAARAPVPARREPRGATRKRSPLTKSNRKTPLETRAEQEATRAIASMNRCFQAYYRTVAVERKRVYKLARQTERIARELVKRQADPASTRKVGRGATDLGRALGRLEQMEAGKRRELRMRRLREARRLRQLEKNLIAVRKEVRAVEEKLKRLNRLARREPPTPPRSGRAE